MKTCDRGVDRAKESQTRQKRPIIEQRSSLASVLEQAEGLSGDAADALGHHAAQFGRRLLADVSHLQINH